MSGYMKLYVAVLYTKERPALKSEEVEYIFVDCNNDKNVWDIAGLCLNGFILADAGVSEFCCKYAIARVRVSE